MKFFEKFIILDSWKNLSYVINKKSKNLIKLTVFIAVIHGGMEILFIWKFSELMESIINQTTMKLMVQRIIFGINIKFLYYKMSIP